jgi:putative colanic acid biosynthesis acetyltransferase WcaF
MLLRVVSSERPQTVARRLAQFDRSGYDKGRSWLWQASWFAVMNAVWSAWWFPARFRPGVLRLFGARVGTGVLIRHRVRVLWPWKLEIGADSWVGEDVWLLNLEPIVIGADVCVSQGAFLCTGNHDVYDPRMAYRNRPIHVGDGAWIAARAFIAPGQEVPAGSFVPVGARGAHDRSP